MVVLPPDNGAVHRFTGVSLTVPSRDGFFSATARFELQPSIRAEDYYCLFIMVAGPGNYDKRAFVQDGLILGHRAGQRGLAPFVAYRKRGDVLRYVSLSPYPSVRHGSHRFSLRLTPAYVECLVDGRLVFRLRNTFVWSDREEKTLYISGEMSREKDKAAGIVSDVSLCASNGCTRPSLKSFSSITNEEGMCVAFLLDKAHVFGNGVADSTHSKILSRC